MNIGQTIEIEGISRHGKNRVREQGSSFEIEKIQDQVPFSDKPGPWLRLKHRWIHSSKDENFRIKSK